MTVSSSIPGAEQPAPVVAEQRRGEDINQAAVPGAAEGGEIIIGQAEKAIDSDHQHDRQDRRLPQYSCSVFHR